MSNIEAFNPNAQKPSRWNLDGVLHELRESREVTHNIRHGGHVRELPSPAVMLEVLESLCGALFPTHLGHGAVAHSNTDVFVRNNLLTSMTRLTEQIRKGLSFGAAAPDPNEDHLQRATAITQDLIAALPSIRATLVSDLKAAFDADDTASSLAEILLCSRGMTAIVYHRIAHALHGGGAQLVARVISDLAHATTGIDIHPAARIAESFYISHGTGIVIGETAVVGRHVQISQGVTLGARPAPQAEPQPRNTPEARHPVIEDHVVIHAGAAVLGPIRVGRGSIVGGNVWLTESVPPGSLILQSPARATAA